MTTQTQPRPHWTELLDKNRQNVSYALLSIGGALLVAAAILMWRSGWPAGSLIVGFLLFGLTALGCGLWFQAGASGGLTGRDTARLLVLILGGVLGLAITVATAWQTVAWWNYVSGGTEVWQGPEGWHIWLLAGLFVVGLALMFASLLLARGEENENPALRRLLYGYNAVLTGLLVLGILAALNVLAYLYLPVSSDWTEAGIYTLSSKSEETLKGLKQPVTVYVMEQMRGDRFDTEMRDLIENARSVSDKIQAEYVIRDINREEMQRLKVLYKPSGTLGLIVVYGSGEGAPHTFIPESEVLPQSFTPPGRQGPREEPFKGEDRLMSAIRSLEDGKKPILYFTQGSGELDLFGLNPASPPDRRGQLLLDNLEKRDNYEVKGLMLAVEGAKVENPRVVVSKTVPEDAAVVVVAGPTNALQPATIEALKKYMREPHKEKDPLNPEKDRQRKGKLMVLADVVAEDNRMKPLNLDQLVGEYNVDVTNERILRFTGDPRDPRPELVGVTPNPNLKGRNPLATLFENVLIPMNDVRLIRPRSAGGRGEEGGSRHQATELLLTAHALSRGGAPVFAESDLRPPTVVLKNYMEKDQAELENKLRATLPVGVSVSEPAAMDPNDPHAALGGMRGEGTPRLEVIGDSTFVSNESLGRAGREETTARANYELFASALAWLREKPGNMGIEPKDRGSYTMQQEPNFYAMLLLPVGLMSLTVLGLGLGVWVARRR